MSKAALLFYCLSSLLVFSCSLETEDEEDKKVCAWNVEGNKATESCTGQVFICAEEGFSPKLVNFDYSLDELSGSTNPAYPRCQNEQGDMSLYHDEREGVSIKACQESEFGSWFEVHYANDKKWTLCEYDFFLVYEYAFSSSLSCDGEQLEFSQLSFPSRSTSIPRCFYKDSKAVYIPEDSLSLTTSLYVSCAEEETGHWYHSKIGDQSFLMQCDGAVLREKTKCEERDLEISEDRLRATCNNTAL